MIEISDLYLNLPRLETARLVLRKYEMSDVPDVYTYSSDEWVTRYLRWGPHGTPEQTEHYLWEVLREYQQGRDGPWGTELVETGQVIGAVHLMRVSAQHRKAAIGFLLAQSYWGRGLMTEALVRVLEYVFEDVGLNRVEAFPLVENRAGIRLLERVGFVQEGVLREYAYQKGAFRDFCVFSMLERDRRDLYKTV